MYWEALGCYGVCDAERVLLLKYTLNSELVAVTTRTPVVHSGGGSYDDVMSRGTDVIMQAQCGARSVWLE